MKIIIDKNIPYIKGVFEPFADVIYLPGAEFSQKVVKDADALIIRTRTKCTRELLEGSSVKVIASATIGFDHIDTKYCEQNNIIWSNAKGCNSRSVHQYIISALLYLSKKNNFSLKDKTLGIIGKGNIGSLIKSFAETIGMSVLVNDPPLEREGITNLTTYDNVLKNSDIITYHVPLNMSGKDKTYHLLNEDTLGKLKDGCFIINSSRGEVVDNNAILEEIKTNRLGGVILDVWENEPNINTELLKRVDLGTSHIAGYSADGKVNGTQIVVQKVAQVLDLPFKDWEFKNIPLPSIIGIQSDSNDLLSCLQDLVPKTYSIENDSINLKKDIHSFEALRNNYGIRREFPAYNITLKTKDENVIKGLEEIGFIC